MGKTLIAILAQQDYLWFLACIGWVCATALSGLSPAATSRFSWRIWLYLQLTSGLAVAAMETAWLLWPMSRSVSQPAYFAELLLVAGLALGVVGSLLALHPRISLPWILVAGSAGAATVVCHEINPLGAGILLAVLSLFAAGLLAWRWRRDLDAAPRWRAAAAVACGLHPLLSSVGPLAEVFGGSHRLLSLSTWSLVAAVFQLLATVCALRAGMETARVQLARTLGADFTNRLRRVGGWVGVWLGAGFALAWVSGNLAARQYDAGLLVRATTAASWFNKSAVEECLVPEFKVDRFEDVKQDDGSVLTGGRSLFIARQARAALRPELTRVLHADPEIIWATIATQRSRWLVSFAMPERVWWDQDWIQLDRPLEAADRIRWARRAAWVEDPATAGFDAVRAFAPLITREGRMLGWLELVYSPTARVRSQVQARFQTFALVGLGLVVGLLFFVQRLRRQEQEAATREAQLAAEADRTKTSFLAKVSHELRTPLQSMLGYGELLAQQPIDPQARRWLTASQAHGTVLVRLVSDLIDLSALQMSAFRLVEKPVRPLDLIRQVVQSLEPAAAKKNLSLRFVDEGRDDAWVLADADRLRQIAVNLIHNAIKFTAAGGIEVRASLVSEKAADPCRFELAVTDSGPGISAAEQALLFQPFRRLHATENQEGSGLGLALSGALCRAMRGGLTVQSDGRTGSTFTAKTELSPVTAPDAQPESVAQNALVGKRVLVADDNLLVRQLFEAFLLSHGARVDQVDQGEAALSACEATAYDALVLDVSMPRLNGWDVARRLRASPYRPAIVVGVSAHATATDQERAHSAGMDHFLTKPVGMGTFIAALVPHRATATPEADIQLAALRAGWRRQFWTEAPALLEHLESAHQTGDWARLRQHAHYLKNSADVIGFESLAAACARLESTEATAAAASALDLIRHLLAAPPAAMTPASL